MSKWLTATVVAMSVSLTTQASAGIVNIFDGTFDNNDYEVQLDGSGANTSFSSTGSQVPLGGVPGQFRQTNNNAVGRFGGADTERVYGWHFNVAQPYDPAVGEILTLDYSEDSVRISGAAQEGRLVLRQDGILFRSEASFNAGVSSTEYTNNQLDGLSASDFEAYFNGVFLPTANPDFTRNGGVIEFGYWRSYVSNQNFGNSSGIDNWSVTLTTEAIPEPSTVLLLGMGLALVANKRKRA